MRRYSSKRRADRTDLVLVAVGLVGLLLCISAYCSYKQTMTDGEWMEVVEIRSCRNGTCAIKVRNYSADLEDTLLYDKETDDTVFIGSRVSCDFTTCYKR